MVEVARARIGRCRASVAERRHPCRPRARPYGPEDCGAILILALVLCVLLGVAATALASYVAVGLKTTGVTDRRLEQLTATDGGLRAGASSCSSRTRPTAPPASFPITLTIDDASVSSV